MYLRSKIIKTMELTGKIIAVLPAREGTAKSTGNPWKVQSYVLETHENYPKKMCFEVYGEDKISSFNIKMGEELTVSFDIDARQWQDRWFNTIRAWKVDRVADNAAQPASPVPNAVPAPAPTDVPFTESGNSNDDLPF
jgi:hypothetical protein